MSTGKRHKNALILKMLANWTSGDGAGVVCWWCEVCGVYARGWSITSRICAGRNIEIERYIKPKQKKTLILIRANSIISIKIKTG